MEPLHSWAGSLDRINPENNSRSFLKQDNRKLSLREIFATSQKHLDSVEDVNQLTGMLFTNSDKVIEKLSAIHTIATGLTRIAKHAFEKHQKQRPAFSERSDGTFGNAFLTSVNKRQESSQRCRRSSNRCKTS